MGSRTGAECVGSRTGAECVGSWGGAWSGADCVGCQERWGQGLKCRGNQGFNNKIKQKNINHPEGEKQAGRQAGRHKTGAQSTWNTHDVRQRISTGLQTQGYYIGRQTRVTRETQLEPLKQWLSNKMGGDRQSTWEHMALNKQQAMCSTHRDIWWPAWAHQQDRDTMNAERYIKVLEQHLLPSRWCLFQGRPRVFQQDNANPHTAAIKTTWLRSRRVRVLNWPAVQIFYL